MEAAATAAEFGAAVVSPFRKLRSVGEIVSESLSLEEAASFKRDNVAGLG